MDAERVFSNHLKEDIWVLLRFMEDMETNKIGWIQRDWYNHTGAGPPDCLPEYAGASLWS